jgi:radical SAM protein with 4Fe4S-binding SPASM domain
LKKNYVLEKAILETTSRCNLFCLICGSDCRNINNPQELSAEEWCRVIGEMQALGLKEVFFSGGEPTLKPGLGEMIEYAASHGLGWGMVSNGFDIPQELFDLFAKRKPIAIGLSVDGTLDTHNTIRRNVYSFQMVEKTIGEFQKREIPFSIITTVHKMNWRELFQVANFVYERGIYGWQIQLAMPFGRMKENQNLLLSEEEFWQVCLMVQRIRKILPEVRIAAADCFAWAPAGTVREGRWEGCSAGLESLGIDALGNVRGCLSMTGCQPEGNIRQRSIAEIWRDETLFRYNRDFNAENTSAYCRQCPKIMRCRGGCNSQSYSMTEKLQQGVYCYFKSNEQRRQKG